MKIRPFEPSDEAAVITVWDTCGLLRPWNDPHKDIARKLAISPKHFLVGVDDDGTIIATVMVGYDGHRGWLYYLGVLPKLQKRGFGRAIVEEAERILRELGCPKINLQVRTSNTQVIDFYRSIGFVEDAVMSMGKRLEHDDASPTTT